jgi:hypothetical protein
MVTTTSALIFFSPGHASDVTVEPLKLVHGLLSLHLQPHLDQAANGFGAAGKVVLLPTPVIKLFSHIGLNADANQIASDRSSLF